MPNPGINEAKPRIKNQPKSATPLSPPFFVSLHAVPYAKKDCTADISCNNKSNRSIRIPLFKLYFAKKHIANEENALILFLVLCYRAYSNQSIL